jgi:hypothetical protein
MPSQTPRWVLVQWLPYCSRQVNCSPFLGVVIHIEEFGLPIFPVVGGHPDLVRDASGLQGYWEFLLGRFGID